MRHLNWTNRTNILEIDGERKVVNRLVGELMDLVRSGADSQAVLSKTGLVSTSISRLHSIEEGYFNKFRYREANAHGQEHKRISAELVLLGEQYDLRQPLMNRGAADRFLDLLVIHGQKSDQQFFDHVKRVSISSFMGRSGRHIGQIAGY